jgi:hypothetical protein
MNADSDPVAENLDATRKFGRHQLDGWKREFVGSSLVYTNTRDRKMSDIIEVSDEEQFAKCSESRDLQVYCDAGDVETQLMEAIDSAQDFFRLLHVSMRRIATNQRRPFEDGN